MDNLTVGDQLKNIRKTSINKKTGKSYTQEDFSDLLKVKRTTYAAYELSRIIPDQSLLDNIEKIFNKKITLLNNSGNRGTEMLSNSANEILKLKLTYVQRLAAIYKR